MKKVAIYIRVSTQEQEKEGYSIPAQKERLTSYCKAKNWLIYDYFIDGGYSGANIDRPALQRLLKALNDIDIVLVYKLDRLSRSQKDTLYLIEDEFLANKVNFASITESFDTTTPFGMAMIGILSVFAQLERDNTRERTTMGRLERAKKGLWCGTPNPPIGYDLVDSNLIVNEYEAMQVREIFNLYIKGYGTQRIQNVFRKKGYTTKYGDWDNISTHTITRIIANRTYIGEVSFAKEYFKGIHDPIIDTDTFNKANNLHKERKGKARPLKYYLSGLLYCSKCGAKYITDKKRDRSFYICKNRKYAYKNDIKCDNTIYNTDELEEEMKLKIKLMLENKDDLIKEYYESIEVVEDKTVIKDRVKEIDKQIDKLMDLYQLDNIPLGILSDKINKLHEEKKSLSKNEVVEVETFDIEEIIELLKDFDVVWDKLDVLEKREIASILLGGELRV